MNYYNEFDKDAAAWLRNLIDNGEIPYGYVDERSITEVEPSDLEGFTQCHFFAGIGGWPLALRIAGVPDDAPVWTGSPPCQPFSVAGKRLGFNDPRHLSPQFIDLVAECRPPVLFGEQVKAAITSGWLDFIQSELQAEGYIFGAGVLPAGCLGAPHQRDRLFIAGGLANMYHERYRQPVTGGPGEAQIAAAGNRQEVTFIREPVGTGSLHDDVANTNGERLEGKRSEGDPERWEKQNFRPAGLFDGTGAKRLSHCGWQEASWLRCRDERFRATEPGTQPLAYGLSAAMGHAQPELQRMARHNHKVRLKGYGNAIVPQLAAEFILSTGLINEYL